MRGDSWRARCFVGRVVRWLFPALMMMMLATTLSACAARAPAIRAETDSRVALARRGGELFKEYCNACHPSGGRGVGPALDRSLARESAIQQIREGIGDMPGFPALADPDVDALLAFVDGLVFRAELARQKEADRTAGEVVRMIDALGWEDPGLPGADWR